MPYVNIATAITEDTLAKHHERRCVGLQVERTFGANAPQREAGRGILLVADPPLLEEASPAPRCELLSAQVAIANDPVEIQSLDDAARRRLELGVVCRDDLQPEKQPA